jgi:hypothetical protein
MNKGGSVKELEFNRGDLYNLLFSVRDRRDALEGALKGTNASDEDWSLVADLSALEAKIELNIAYANGGW